MDSDKLELFISEKDIQNKVSELAGQISADYKGKVPLVICVLKGAFIFLSDLVRNLSIDAEIDFIRISSYGNSSASSGRIKLLKDVECGIEGKNIIVVEDIIDTGLSAKYLRELLLKRRPASLEFAALLIKNEICKLDFDVKYKGFDIPDKFVVGYGLDYAQKYRQLKEVYILENQK